MDKFYFYSDPGHAWLEVHIATLKALGIQHKISGYSYRQDNLCYLEEDCDAPIFLEAYKNTYGTTPKILEEYQEDTPIRRYPSYHA